MFLLKSAMVATGVLAGVIGFSPASGHGNADATTKLSSGDICVSLSGARGCFHPDGDHVKVYDTRADGERPSVQWRTSYGRDGECWWTGTSPHTDCNYDMRENATIKFRLYLHGHVIEATGWKLAPIGNR